MNFIFINSPPNLFLFLKKFFHNNLVLFYEKLKLKGLLQKKIFATVPYNFNENQSRVKFFKSAKSYPTSQRAINVTS